MLNEWINSFSRAEIRMSAKMPVKLVAQGLEPELECEELESWFYL